ncbi:large repetitive protein [Vibrio sp. JCM 19052]|nr:large repetitive protein [Vibrio sp. JCM 19052]
MTVDNSKPIIDSDVTVSESPTDPSLVRFLFSIRDEAAVSLLSNIQQRTRVMFSTKRQVWITHISILNFRKLN